MTSFPDIEKLFDKWYEVHGKRLQVKSKLDDEYTKALMKVAWSYGFIKGEKG